MIAGYLFFRPRRRRFRNFNWCYFCKGGKYEDMKPNQFYMTCAGHLNVYPVPEREHGATKET